MSNPGPQSAVPGSAGGPYGGQPPSAGGAGSGAGAGTTGTQSAPSAQNLNQIVSNLDFFSMLLSDVSPRSFSPLYLCHPLFPRTFLVASNTARNHHHVNTCWKWSPQHGCFVLERNEHWQKLRAALWPSFALIMTEPASASGGCRSLSSDPAVVAVVRCSQ
ncbi:hypothetical protein VTI74DRAFT_5998 [Chaetomium olivicolor]